MSWVSCPTHEGWWLAQPPDVEEQVFLEFKKRRLLGAGLWAWVPKRLLYANPEMGRAQELVDTSSYGFSHWEFRDMAVPDVWEEKWEAGDE